MISNASHVAQSHHKEDLSAPMARSGVFDRPMRLVYKFTHMRSMAMRRWLLGLEFALTQPILGASRQGDK
jgi:hypothetical protein